jgi:hypothetical protein
MQAEIVLTPTESKKLISMATLHLEEVRGALTKGIVVLHPSSSTFFLFQEIAGQPPEGVWVCGVVSPKGLCGSREELKKVYYSGLGIHDPLQFRQSWFFKDGVLQEKTPLGEILDQMTERDVYVKGANALDPQGNVGVLYANPAGGGGTIGRVMKARRKQGFHLILPIGLEKLIPVSIQEASRKAGFKNVDQAMGKPCGVIPVAGKKIDEIDAFTILSGAQATPIAAGGLGGAEGGLVLALHGSEGKLQEALKVTHTVKGAQLPMLDLPECDTCESPNCHFVRDRRKEAGDGK